MTTDNFTEAARAEAERRWSRDQADGRPLPGYARMSRRIGFEIGALWAAAQEPTDAEVEAACAGFYEDPSGLTSWTGLVKAEPRLAEVYREGIRRALSAARAARRDEETR